MPRKTNGETMRLTPYQKSLKQVICSIIFILALFALTAQTVVTAWQQFSNVTALQETRSTFQQLEAILPSIKILSDLYLAIMIILVCVLIPILLIAVGSWIFYLSNVKSKKLSDAGLLVAKIGLVLYIVYSAFICGVLIYALFSIKSADGATRSSVASIVFLVLACVTALVFVLLLFYYLGAIKTINVGVEIARTGSTRKKPSLYLIILNYILILLKILFFMGSTSASHFLVGAIDSDEVLSIMGTVTHTQDVILGTFDRVRFSALISIFVLLLFNVLLHYIRGKLTDVKDEERAAYDPRYKDDFDNTYF